MEHWHVVTSSLFFVQRLLGNILIFVLITVKVLHGICRKWFDTILTIHHYLHIHMLKIKIKIRSWLFAKIEFHMYVVEVCTFVKFYSCLFFWSYIKVTYFINTLSKTTWGVKKVWDQIRRSYQLVTHATLKFDYLAKGKNYGVQGQ